jgi:hypothetical protein
MLTKLPIIEQHTFWKNIPRLTKASQYLINIVTVASKLEKIINNLTTCSNKLITSIKKTA